MSFTEPWSAGQSGCFRAKGICYFDGDVNGDEFEEDGGGGSGYGDDSDDDGDELMWVMNVIGLTCFAVSSKSGCLNFLCMHCLVQLIT